jgi:hypothetical protein
MLTRFGRRGAVVAGIALALSACSAVHPGDAVVIGKESVSLSTLDETAQAYCVFTLNQAKAQGIEAISNADLRRQAALGLASHVVARKVADEQGVSVRRADYVVSAAEKKQIAEVFADQDIDLLVDALQDSREVSAIAVELAAKAAGTEPTAESAGQFEEAGRNLITAAFADYDVKFAPRLGLSPTGAQRANTGSLSVASVDFEQTPAEELPEGQRCS